MLLFISMKLQDRKEILEIQVQPEQQDQKVTLEILELRETQGILVQLVLQVQQDQSILQVP